MLRRGTALSFLAAVLLAGCPQGGQGAPAASGFKVALVTPGPTTDMGWNALAWDGAQKIEKELGSAPEYLQEGDQTKFESVLKRYAVGGTNLIFAHGFEYQEACEKVSEKFPKTYFVVTSGSRARGNVSRANIRIDEALYLAGLLAAHLSQTKKLGCVGGMPIPSVKGGFEAFERAARKADKSVTVQSAYLDSWDDAVKGREQALAFAAAGCDVIVHNADHAGIGVFKACKEKGIRAIGANRDQNSVEPGVVVASATADFARCMLDVAKDVKEGRFQPRDILLDMKSGYVDLALSPNLVVPAEVKKEIDEAKKAIVAGTLDPCR